jgi:hypothetical protein
MRSQIHISSMQICNIENENQKSRRRLLFELYGRNFYEGSCDSIGVSSDLSLIHI